MRESLTDKSNHRQFVLRHARNAVFHNPCRNIQRTVERVAGPLRKIINDLASGSADWPLFLCGETGTGKTCAGLCVIDHYGGWYTTLQELNELRLRVDRGEEYWSGPHGDRVTIVELWDMWGLANVTVLDELGIRTPTEPQYETLKRAIDLRENRPAIFISNLSVGDMSNVYDDRIVSRLSAGTVPPPLVGDRRLT